MESAGRHDPESLRKLKVEEFKTILKERSVSFSAKERKADLIQKLKEVLESETQATSVLTASNDTDSHKPKGGTDSSNAEAMNVVSPSKPPATVDSESTSLATADTADHFRKTEALPSLYWIPASSSGHSQRLQMNQHREMPHDARPPLRMFNGSGRDRDRDRRDRSRERDRPPTSGRDTGRDSRDRYRNRCFRNRARSKDRDRSPVRPAQRGEDVDDEHSQLELFWTVLCQKFDSIQANADGILVFPNGDWYGLSERNLYVRPCYKTLFAEFVNVRDEAYSTGTISKTVITGTSGTGKSTFLIYLMLELVREAKNDGKVILIRYSELNVVKKSVSYLLSSAGRVSCYDIARMPVVDYDLSDSTDVATLDPLSKAAMVVNSEKVANSNALTKPRATIHFVQTLVSQCGLSKS
jgi:hypothetical protein